MTGPIPIKSEVAEYTASDDRGEYAVTEETLATAFTEWDRRYCEEPERFYSEAEHLLKMDAETYGEQCAPYLIALLTGAV